MSDELNQRVSTLETTVYGDRNNLKERPGIAAELARTNEILSDVRDSMQKLNWMVIGGFVTALLALVMKHFGGIDI